MLKHSWTRIWVGLAADGLGYWLCVGIKHPQVLQQETAQHVKHSLDPFQVCVCLLSVCQWWSTSCRFWSGVVFHCELTPLRKWCIWNWNIYSIELINLLSPPTEIEIKQTIYCRLTSLAIFTNMFGSSIVSDFDPSSSSDSSEPFVVPIEVTVNSPEDHWVAWKGVPEISRFFWRVKFKVIKSLQLVTTMEYRMSSGEWTCGPLRHLNLDEIDLQWLVDICAYTRLVSCLLFDNFVIILRELN